MTYDVPQKVTYLTTVTPTLYTGLTFAESAPLKIKENTRVIHTCIIESVCWHTFLCFQFFTIHKESYAISCGKQLIYVSFICVIFHYYSKSYNELKRRLYSVNHIHDIDTRHS